MAYTAAPGWYTDPMRDGDIRWWDGTRWRDAPETPPVRADTVPAEPAATPAPAAGLRATATAVLRRLGRRRPSGDRSRP